MARPLFRWLGIIGLTAALWAAFGCGDDKSTSSTTPPATHDSTYTADHLSANDFALVPESTFTLAQSSFRIFYGHTSHGSQIITGLSLLYDENPSLQLPAFHEVSDDLGADGDTSWVPITRAWLDAHPEYNMAMWSWCGGVSGNTVEGINAYLNALAGLEADYPNVTFVYMTGHLDGTGVDGNLYARNNQIRAYCAANGKLLFDFADIESYDPAGTFYPNESDACSWCADWCASRDCDECSCAHSHCYNCYRKGRAFWWMLARLSGWDGE